jgi:hypothetical protein
MVLTKYIFLALFLISDISSSDARARFIPRGTPAGGLIFGELASCANLVGTVLSDSPDFIFLIAPILIA